MTDRKDLPQDEPDGIIAKAAELQLPGAEEQVFRVGPLAPRRTPQGPHSSRATVHRGFDAKPVIWLP